MIGINAGGIISAVASIAGIGRIGIIPVVTGIAIIGNGHMRTCEGINGVVVKGGRYPGRLGVAEGTVGWELRGGVVWIGGLGVIAVVATVTGIGGVVVISIVAGIAIIGNGHVRTDKWINGIMVESRRCPRGLGVAKRAVGRILLCRMVRVSSLRVISVVTTVAGVGGVGIISIVAGGAVIGDGGMRTVKRPVVGVLRESGGLPSGVGGVALRAIGRQV